jgi:poly(glycerol-phosphate) alpha-glucosyltransferase
MPNPQLSILYGIGSIYNRSSGPYLTTLQTAKELRRRGHHVAVIGSKSTRDVGVPEDWAGIQTIAFPKMGPASLHYAPRAAHWLRRSTIKPDVVSLEGVWLHLFGTIARWAKKRGMPYIITAHGNFNPVALAVSSWKKTLARRWFGDDLLRNASCFHAITEQEYRWIRRYGLRQPVCVIPNGIELPCPQSFPRPALANRPTALFIGRLHRIKGLDLLLKAWAATARSHAEWQLVIAGNDDGAGAELTQLQSALALNDSVHFIGPVHGDIKQAWLQACDFFVLPSRSEGLAMSPLEAMAYSKPVLLTATSNFPQAAQCGAGVEVDCSEAGLAKGIEQMISAPNEALARMGEHGRKLVQERFNWMTICTQLEPFYGWLAGKNDPPSTVRFD